jgi:hypothetical protein
VHLHAQHNMFFNKHSGYLLSTGKFRRNGKRAQAPNTAHIPNDSAVCSMGDLGHFSSLGLSLTIGEMCDSEIVSAAQSSKVSCGGRGGVPLLRAFGSGHKAPGTQKPSH